MTSAEVATPAPERRRRRDARDRAILIVQRLVLLAVLLAGWEAAVAYGKIQALWVSRPSAIATTLWEFFVGGSIYPHLLTTLGNALAGLAAGSLGGIVLGFLMARFDRFGKIIDPFINFFYSIPRIALAPLFVLWFGIGLGSKVATIFAIVFFLLLVNTVTGIRQVDRHLVRGMQAMGATRWQINRYVVIPSTLVWILAGLRLAIPQSVIGAVIAEYVGATKGLGYLILFASANLDTTTVLSAVVVLGVISILITEIVNKVESILLRWNAST